jgi:hypothetical protein
MIAMELSITTEYYDDRHIDYDGHGGNATGSTTGGGKSPTDGGMIHTWKSKRQ